MNNDDINKLEEFMKCLETFSITIGTVLITIIAALLWL